MTIDRIQMSPLASAQYGASAKFGSAATSSGGAMYRFSNGFLSMHENLMASKITPMLKSKSGWTRGWGEGLKVLSNSLLTHDFSRRVPMFNWGKVAVRPPLGALGISFYLGIIPSRLYAASKRPDIDPGEYLDIIIRDVLSISAFVYMLEPVRNAFGRWYEKRTGLRMMQHGEAMAYDTIDDLYRVTHPNRLLHLVADKGNHKGIKRVLGEMAQNKYLKSLYREEPEVLKGLERFKGMMQTMMNDVSHRKLDGQLGKVLNDPALQKAAKEGYQLVHQLEGRLQKRLYDQAGSLAKSGVRVKDLYKVPTFKNMFAASTNLSRVWIDVLGFAIVIGFLGWGVTAFNEWYTAIRKGKEREALATGTPPNGAPV